jgi:tRNA-dihydrouridine synthase
MVDHSGLAFRTLCRRVGAIDLAFTPMISAQQFVSLGSDAKRRLAFPSTPEDSPVGIQFCGSDPDTLARASEAAQRLGADVVDLNLGCPQPIARKGEYGAYLAHNHPDLVFKIVERMAAAVDVPVTCKVRLQDWQDGGRGKGWKRATEAADAASLAPRRASESTSAQATSAHCGATSECSEERTSRLVSATVPFAQSLVDAGAAALTLHGRTKEQRQTNTGSADWDAIAQVRGALPADLPFINSTSLVR